MKISFGPFSGIRPRTNKRYLGNTEAQIAQNCDLTAMSLRPRQAGLLTEKLAASGWLSTIYLWGTGDTGRWLQFADTVDIVRGFVAGDETEKTYITDGALPVVTNSDLVDVGGNDEFPESSYPLGLPAPENALTAETTARWRRQVIYALDDVVVRSGKFFISLQDANNGHDPLSNWASSTAYAEDDVVIYRGSFYVSQQAANTGNIPGEDTDWWVEIEEWDSDTEYDAGEFVFFLGRPYESLLASNLCKYPDQTWRDSIKYNEDDVASADGSFFISLRDANTDHDPETNWDEDETYDAGDIVVASGAHYLSLHEANYGYDPELGADWWVDNDEITEWRAVRTYAENDVVVLDSVPYISLQSSNVGHDPETETDWWEDASGSFWWSEIAAWSSGTTYADGDLIVYHDVPYRSLQDANTGHTPTDGIEWWEDARGTTFWWEKVQAWDSGTTYYEDDVVVHEGVAYISLADANTGYDPETETTWWESLADTAWWSDQIDSSFSWVQTVSPSGAGDERDVQYVYTYVRTWPDGTTDEGPPSPVSDELTAMNEEVVNLSDMDGAVSDRTDITHKRIYRLNAGQSGADFLFVDEVAVATTTFEDDVSDDDLEETLPSEGWDAPPDDLVGIVAHPGMFLVGFRGNEVRASEVLHCHAWPSSYSWTVPFDIVGLGVYGSTVVVLTTSFPYLLTGSSPDSMTMERLPAAAPCLSKRGIVSTEAGVMFPCPRGLYIIGGQQVGLATANLFTKSSWSDYYPETIHAVWHDGKYIGFFSSGESGKTKVGQGFVFDPAESNANFTTLGFYAYALHVDEETDTLYYVDYDSLTDWNYVKEWEGNSSKLTYTWRSGEAPLPGKINFAVARVDADFPDAVSEGERDAMETERQATIAANEALFLVGPTDVFAAIGGAAIGMFAISGDNRADVVASYTEAEGVVLRIYGERDTLRHETTVTSSDPISLPGNFKDRFGYVELSSKLEVFVVDIATKREELN